MTWRTEIADWQPPVRFVDRQLRGPYREWVHTHRFTEQDGGTLVEDHVRYRLWGPEVVMRLVHTVLVAPDLARIFEFRHSALLDAFDAHAQARLGPVLLGPCAPDADL